MCIRDRSLECAHTSASMGRRQMTAGSKDQRGGGDGGRALDLGLQLFRALGQGTVANMLVPTMVPAGGLEGAPVLMVACGYFHALAVTRAGALYACGFGADGQLGLNDKEHSNVFERVRLPVLSDARIVTAFRV